MPHIGYGYGWFIGYFHDQPVYFHTGDNPGYASLNAIVPTGGIRVIVLSNDATFDVYTAGIELLEAALD